MSENQLDRENKRKVSLPLLFLFLLSLALNAYLFYNWYQNNYQDGRSLKEINAELQEVIGQTEFSRDSLQKEYDDLSEQYQALIDEAENLRVERIASQEEVGRQKVRIRQLLSQANSNPRKLVAANKEIEALKKQLLDFQSQIDIVKEERDKYASEANAQKEYSKALEEQKDQVEARNTDLEKRMEDATFQISEMVVKPMRMKRKKWEETDKSGKVEQIEISFTILESPLIEPGEKELLLRVVGTNREVLGANNGQLTDSDKLFSMKKDFTYSGTEEDFKFTFKQEEAYKKGGHYAEIWSDGKMLVRSPFNLN
jgi:hypothetical protein